MWPLRNVVNELKRVQRGQAIRMSEHHPRELEPLTASINALVESERENLDHQRNTMSDLAHSLKTPLAVLRTRLDNDASEAELREEVDIQLRRSEEHTSELQSLMRISYDGFCLKTKNTPYRPQHNHTSQR